MASGSASRGPLLAVLLAAAAAASAHASAPQPAAADPTAACPPAKAPKRQQRQAHKLFFIGTGKTGTHTLAELAERRGFRSCHYSCHPKPGAPSQFWKDRTTAHDASSTSVLAVYDAFSDTGFLTDWRWLERTFNDARFVLNTRPLQSWLVSRIDHVRNADGARKGKPIHANWFDEDWIAKRVVSLSQTQEEILRYFNKTQDRRNRFAVLDIITQPPSTVKAITDWVSASNSLLTDGDPPPSCGPGMRRAANSSYLADGASACLLTL
jgi:hypothetical protein